MKTVKINFKDNLNTYQNVIKNYEVDEQIMDGVTYKVVPVVMMVEGVHNGSHGAVLHTAEQLGAIVESWNGIPITYTHPEVDGEYVPANSPKILETFGLGRVFNAFMDEGKLKAEAWFDVNKLSAFDELEERIDEGDVIEVSVGIFSDEKKVKGNWNGESYTAIAYNYRPEHLAILPNDVGACSVKDGCGLRTNKNNNSMQKLITNQNRDKILRELNTEGMAVHFSVFEDGMKETVDKVRSKLYSLEDDEVYMYLEEVYPSYLIYNKTSRVSNTSGYYKRSYTIENGKVSFMDDVVEVERKVEYLAIGDTTINNNSKSKKDMADEKKDCTPCVKDKVTALIANEVTRFKDTDREWMETLSLEALEMLEPIVQEKTVEVNKDTTPEMAVNLLKKDWKTVDDVLKVVPEGIKKEIDTALATHTKAKDGLVTAIMANTEEGIWTKEKLESMDVDVLESIYKTSKIEVNKEDSPVEDSGAVAGLIFTVNTKERKDKVMLPRGLKKSEEGK